MRCERVRLWLSVSYLAALWVRAPVHPAGGVSFTHHNCKPPLLSSVSPFTTNKKKVFPLGQTLRNVGKYSVKP